MLEPKFAPTTLVGTRIVALPAAVDQLINTLPASMSALRFAHDEVLLLGKGQLEIDDEYAIIEREVGFSAFQLSLEDFERVVRPRLEWTISSKIPSVSQGRFLGVSVKIWMQTSGASVICPTSFTHELAERL